MQQPSTEVLNINNLPKLQLKQEDNITVSGNDFSVTFNKKAGALSSFKSRGKELLEGNVIPNFWRVPTDNDEGGKSGSYAHRWRTSGLDNVTMVPVEMKAELIQPQVARVQINNSIPLKKGSIDYIAVYTIYGSGDIEVQNFFSTNDQLPPLARVGLQFKLPAAFNNVTWYGKGPFESYIDRDESAKTGLYKSTVPAQHFSHVMPQENGNKTDVRWMLLSSNAGEGLLVSATDSLLSVNVQDYSLQALNESKLSHQLTRGNNTYLFVDYKQMGLGGDIGWGARVHPEYLLTTKKYQYTFRLKPVSKGVDINKILQQKLPKL
jgi:beta-galactosidase